MTEPTNSGDRPWSAGERAFVRDWAGAFSLTRLAHALDRCPGELVRQLDRDAAGATPAAATVARRLGCSPKTVRQARQALSPPPPPAIRRLRRDPATAGRRAGRRAAAKGWVTAARLPAPSRPCHRRPAVLAADGAFAGRGRAGGGRHRDRPGRPHPRGAARGRAVAAEDRPGSPRGGPHRLRRRGEGVPPTAGGRGRSGRERPVAGRAGPRQEQTEMSNERLPIDPPQPNPQRAGRVPPPRPVGDGRPMSLPTHGRRPRPPRRVQICITVMPEQARELLVMAERYDSPHRRASLYRQRTLRLLAEACRAALATLPQPARSPTTTEDR